MSRTASKLNNQSVLGGCESKRFELAMVPLKVGEEMGKIVDVANEVPQDRGLEAEA